MNIKTIWLFVTNRCNLDCNYCYIRKNPSDINLKTAHRAIDALISGTLFNKCHVVLFGGEPLLKMDLIKKIVEYGHKKSKLNNKKLTFSIYSNGTLMNEKNVKILHKLKIGLDLSLDGIRASQDQERLFKNKKSSFDDITKNIPNLLKYYPNSMVHACISPSNVKYLSKNVNFFCDQGFKRIYLQPVTSVAWPKRELKIFQEELKKTFIIYKNLINNGRIIYFNILEDYIKKLETKKQACITPCPAGIYNFAFSVEGEIFPCHRFVTMCLERKFRSQKEYHKLGDINKGITNKKLYKYFLNFRFEKRKKCKNCEINKICCSCCHWEHYYKNQNFITLNKTVCIIQKTIVNAVKETLIQFPDLSTLDFSTQFRESNIPEK